VQATALFSSFHLNWPSVLKDIMDALSVFSFNLELVHPECSLKGWSFITEWKLVMMLPLAFAGSKP
jgi:hypothetical protein